MSAETVQTGHQYPAVTRVLKPDGGTNANSEWWYYDNGGTYPWPVPTPVTHVLNRMDSLTQTEIDAITVFVNGCVADGNWDLLDEFWCFSLNDTIDDWITGFKAHTVTNTESITRTIDGAITPGSASFTTDLFLNAQSRFVSGDSLIGAYIYAWPVLGNTRSMFGAQTAAGPTAVYWRSIGGTQSWTEMNSDVYFNTFNENTLDGAMISVAGNATESIQYRDDVALATTGDAPVNALPTIALKLFTRNNDGGSSGRCDAGTVISASWVGASIGFNLTTFKARLDTLLAVLKGLTAALALSWVVPIEKADGSAVTALASYDIEYGLIGAVLATVNVPAPSTGHEIPVVPGSYRVRITAIDTLGKRSQLSGFVYGAAT